MIGVFLTYFQTVFFFFTPKYLLIIINKTIGSLTVVSAVESAHNKREHVIMNFQEKKIKFTTQSVGIHCGDSLFIIHCRQL